MSFIEFLANEAQQCREIVLDAVNNIKEVMNKDGEKIDYKLFLKANQKYIIIVICIMFLLISFPLFFIWTLATVVSINEIRKLVMEIMSAKKVKEEEKAFRLKTEKFFNEMITSQQAMLLPIKFRDDYKDKIVVIQKYTEDGLVVKDKTTKMAVFYPWYRIDLSKVIS